MGRSSPRTTIQTPFSANRTTGVIVLRKPDVWGIRYETSENEDNSSISILCIGVPQSPTSIIHHPQISENELVALYSVIEKGLISGRPHAM